jgi:hypothetical protein
MNTRCTAWKVQTLIYGSVILLLGGIGWRQQTQRAELTKQPAKETSVRLVETPQSIPSSTPPPNQRQENFPTAPITHHTDSTNPTLPLANKVAVIAPRDAPSANLSPINKTSPHSSPEASPTHPTTTNQSASNDSPPRSSDLNQPTRPTVTTLAVWPLVLGETPETASKQAQLTPAQTVAVAQLAEEFIAAVGETTSNPADDPEYRKRWIAAQRLYDAQLRAVIGQQAFNAYRLEATSIPNLPNVSEPTSP